MIWNVFYYNSNSRKVEAYNVLHGRKNFIKKLKEKSTSKKEFSKGLRSEMMYHFWSKAEWEILIYPLFQRKDEKETKMDVFDQLELNWDRFVDYCWDYPFTK